MQRSVTGSLSVAIDLISLVKGSCYEVLINRKYQVKFQQCCRTRSITYWIVLREIQATHLVLVDIDDEEEGESRIREC